MKHLLTLEQLSPATIAKIFDLAKELKAARGKSP